MEVFLEALAWPLCCCLVLDPHISAFMALGCPWRWAPCLSSVPLSQMQPSLSCLPHSTSLMLRLPQKSIAIFPSCPFHLSSSLPHLPHLSLCESLSPVSALTFPHPSPSDLLPKERALPTSFSYLPFAPLFRTLKVMLLLPLTCFKSLHWFLVISW